MSRLLENMARINQLAAHIRAMQDTEAELPRDDYSLESIQRDDEEHPLRKYRVYTEDEMNRYLDGLERAEDMNKTSRAK